ncbi:MAG TPA: nucleotide exchange factor GrpE [Lentimicrobium sp.]|jgi:molecular chaperone GrpE|nr:nucleotide exchange factor GrpE [Lentimicrobium sp.]
MGKHQKAKSEEKMNEMASERAEEKISSSDTDNQAQQTQQAGETAQTDAGDFNQKIEELNDKYLRLYSEFDNYRKRVIKEKIELSKTASEDVITGMLTILDDFERAINAFGAAGETDPVKEGVVLIYNKFRNILTQKGLAETDSLGKDFDTDFHEAIANIPAPSEDLKNKIVDVTQKGYTLNGKVIRYAKVVVGS